MIACPTGASLASEMIPSDSSPRPNSAAEHNMPFDTTPRILDLRSFMPFGSVTPGVANGVFIPLTTFGAPQTISRISPLPFDTLHTLKRSASGCFSTSSTSAITTPSSPAPSCSMPSTSCPAIVRRSPNAVVSRSGFTHSRNQDSTIFMTPTGTAARSADRFQRRYANQKRRSAASRDARHPYRTRSR